MVSSLWVSSSGARAHARRRGRGLAAGVAAADHDDIECQLGRQHGLRGFNWALVPAAGSARQSDARIGLVTGSKDPVAGRGNRAAFEARALRVQRFATSDLSAVDYANLTGIRRSIPLPRVSRETSRSITCRCRTAENLAQHVLDIDPAGDPPERMRRLTQVLCTQLEILRSAAPKNAASAAQARLQAAADGAHV